MRTQTPPPRETSTDMEDRLVERIVARLASGRAGATGFGSGGTSTMEPAGETGVQGEHRCWRSLLEVVYGQLAAEH